MADTTSYTPLFKEVVEPRVNTVLDDSTILLRWLQRRKRKFNGQEFEVPLNIAHNQGIGSRSEHGTLPASGQEEYARAKYQTADTWGQMKVSQRLIEMARTDKGAFKDAVSSETQGLITSVKNDLNRQFFGDGTGLLGTCGVTTASTTVTMGSTADVKFIFKGMRIDILTKSTGAVVAADRKVTSVDRTAGTFVIDGAAVTTATTDGVYRAGNKVLTTNYEMEGLAAMVKTTGEFGDLNPTTAGLEQWAGHVFTSVAALADEEIQEAWDAPAENGLDASTDRLIIGTFGTRREFGRALQTQRRFNIQTAPAKHPKLQGGGFDSLEYNGVDFVVDRMCSAQSIYILDREAVEYLVLARGFKEEDGSVLKDDGGTGYKAPYFVMAALGSDNRGAHSKLEGVTESPA